MLCPICRSEGYASEDSRPSEDGTSIRRRRQCGECEARFTTFEQVQLREISVLKRDGRKVPFSREKLERSFNIALRKRSVHENDVVMALMILCASWNQPARQMSPLIMLARWL